MRLVIIVDSGFQDEEFVYPYYRLLEEGWHVDIATPDGRERRGKFGVPARATCTIPIGERQDAYDGIVLPGGFENPDRLRMRWEVCSFVKHMCDSGKLVAAICHAPSILISAGIVRCRRLTGYESIRADLENAGAFYTEAPVVVDANLITSPHYRHNGEFMRAVVDHLRGRI
jgi:protease I